MANSRRELTTTSYAVLGLLCVQPWSAYELAKQMQRSMRFVWPRAISGVYEEPKKLVAHGLAKVSTEVSGRRRKAVYSVTPKGRRALRRWLAQPSAPPQFESEALLRSVFADHGTKDDLLATLQSLHDQMVSLRHQGAALIADYLGGGPFPERLHIIALTTRFLAEYITMLRDWAAWAEAEVENWPDTTSHAGSPGPIERYRAIIGEDLVEEARRILSGAAGESPPSGSGDDVAEAG